MICMKQAMVIVAMLAFGTSAFAQPKGATKITTEKFRIEDFVFKKTPQGELTLHGFFPTDWKPTDQRPVIVFFFGGGWKNGSFTQFVPQSEYFATRGIVAFSADYRIESKHKTTPDVCVEDAKSAIRWVRANAGKLGIDPNKVIASGGSAGGHLAAATAAYPEFGCRLLRRLTRNEGQRPAEEVPHRELPVYRCIRGSTSRVGRLPCPERDPGTSGMAMARYPLIWDAPFPVAMW